MKRASIPKMMLSKEHPCKAELLANACWAAASNKLRLMLFNTFMTSAFGFLVVNASNVDCRWIAIGTLWLWVWLSLVMRVW